MDAAPEGWTREARDLWARIEAHEFESPEIALDFTRRLARQLGWPLDTARGAIAEYRKFCFLALVTTDGPVTPSEEVDEVWHLHLAYTRDYWERWCGVALGRRLHHDPTAGGPAEQHRYRAQYAETLALYERWFGPPPAAFWPGTAKRFAARPRYHMVDRDRTLVLPRPALSRLRAVSLRAQSRRRARAPVLATLLTVATGTPAAAETDWATTWNVLDWSGGPFLQLYVGLLVLAFAVAMLLRWRARVTGARVDLNNLDSLDIAFLQGGRSRAADTLLLELAVRNGARFDKDGIEIGPLARDLPRHLEPFRSLTPGRYKRGELLQAFADSSAARDILDGLARRGLAQDEQQRQASAAAVLLPTIPVLALGVLKILVGLSRDRPVGFLVGLVLVGALALVGLLFKGALVTAEGEQALATLRAGHDRIIRAPRLPELPLAFAFAGASILAGSEYSAYATQMAPVISAGFGGGDGGGDGGGGSGCGGGGCGGCGS